MPYQYLYYKNSSPLLDNFDKALDLIKREQLVLDAKCLTLIEAAERGDTSASHDIHCAFKWGYYGLSPNYRLSLYFFDLSRKKDGDDALLNFHSTCCLGDTHFKFGNFEEAQKAYMDATKIMVNLPVEKWDFGILHILEDLVYKSEK
jgi:hypothetical protein